MGLKNSKATVDQDSGDSRRQVNQLSQFFTVQFVQAEQRHDEIPIGIHDVTQLLEFADGMYYNKLEELMEINHELRAAALVIMKENEVLRKRHCLRRTNMDCFMRMWRRDLTLTDQNTAIQWTIDLFQEENNRLEDFRPWLSNICPFPCAKVADMETGAVNHLRLLVPDNSPISDDQVLAFMLQHASISCIDIYSADYTYGLVEKFEPVVCYARTTTDPIWIKGFQITSFKPGIGLIGRVGCDLPWASNSRPILSEDKNFVRQWFAFKSGIKRGTACKMQIDNSIFVIGFYSHCNEIEEISCVKGAEPDLSIPTSELSESSTREFVLGKVVE